MILMAVFMMMTSCGLTEIDGGQSAQDKGGDVWGGPLEGDPDSMLSQVCCMTAVDYRKGYDWRADRMKGSVKCSLVVYSDGVPVMKIPVGDEYETASDPDMHRMIDGHLFTDYSTDTETVIKRDGELLFRYPGRESICGMAVKGDDVYTLGQNRNGSGFSYRKNGQVLVSREEGVVLGGFGSEDDSLSFAFSDKILSADGEVERYYSVRDETVSQVGVRDDIRRVWDIVHDGNSIIYLASLVGVSAPVLFAGGKMTALPFPKGAVLVAASLFYDKSILCAEYVYSSEGELYTSVWMNGVMLNTFGKGMTMTSRCLLDNGLCCAANPSLSGGKGSIYRCGDLYEMPEGYSCMGQNVVTMVGGILHVGLSSTEGDRPILWKDGQTDTLRINGYISSVGVW